MSRTNKTLVAIVAIALIVVVALLVYLYLPMGGSPGTSGTSITILKDGLQQTFSLSDIQTLKNITSSAGQINKAGVVKSIGNYTGVPIPILLNFFSPNMSRLNITLNVTASDNSYELYNFSTIMGNVPIYALNGNKTEQRGLIMALVYKKDGQLLNASQGPYMIGFLGRPGLTTPQISTASLWWRNVRSIRVIPAS